MISAFLAVLVSNADPVMRLQLSTWFILLGAGGFLLGSMLLMPEAATQGEEQSLLNGPDQRRQRIFSPESVADLKSQNG